MSTQAKVKPNFDWPIWDPLLADVRPIAQEHFAEKKVIDLEKIKYQKRHEQLLKERFQIGKKAGEFMVVLAPQRLKDDFKEALTLFSKDLYRHIRKQVRRGKNKLCKEVIEAQRHQQFAHANRAARALAGTSVGPPKRYNNVKGAANLDKTEWINKLATLGKEGGMSATFVD
jgi:hypothetical protein